MSEVKGQRAEVKIWTIFLRIKVIFFTLILSLHIFCFLFSSSFIHSSHHFFCLHLSCLSCFKMNTSCRNRWVSLTNPFSLLTRRFNTPLQSHQDPGKTAKPVLWSWTLSGSNRDVCFWKRLISIFNISYSIQIFMKLFLVKRFKNIISFIYSKSLAQTQGSLEPLAVRSSTSKDQFWWFWWEQSDQRKRFI